MTIDELILKSKLKEFIFRFGAEVTDAQRQRKIYSFQDFVSYKRICLFAYVYTANCLIAIMWPNRKPQRQANSDFCFYVSAFQ